VNRTLSGHPGRRKRKLHCKKRLSIVLSPAGMSLIKLEIVKIFPARDSLVIVTSQLGTGNGNTDNLFYSVMSSDLSLLTDLHA
jgi:hypothetical protein